MSYPSYMLVLLALIQGRNIEIDIIAPIEPPKLLEPIKKPVVDEIEEVVEDKPIVPTVKPIDHDFEALVRATFRLETGNGSSKLWLSHNNAGGIKCGSEFCKYATQEEGLDHLARLLRTYVDRFGYDFEAIRSMYSESDDTELFTQIYYEEREK